MADLKKSAKPIVVFDFQDGENRSNIWIWVAIITLLVANVILIFFVYKKVSTKIEALKFSYDSEFKKIDKRIWVLENNGTSVVTVNTE